MQRTVFFMLLLVALTLCTHAPVFSADELFDTKAAAEHTEKGIEYLKGKNLDASIKELEESVAINPDAEAYYFLGYAYYLKGKAGDSESRKRSKESFDKAYELNPGFTPSRLMEPAAAEGKEAPAPPPASAQETEPGEEGSKTNVFQGTAQPEAQPPATPEPSKEQPPQPTKPPKEEQPLQQPRTKNP